MANELLTAKVERLKNYLRELGSVAVAFSGGVDSTFLLKVAQETLGDKVIAVTASSKSFPKRELDEAIKFCVDAGIKQIICESEELNIDGFRKNPENRCYLCKRELFEKILRLAEEHKISAVVEGSNMDDNGDYRPGLQAIAELQVKSPLRVAELYKAEIRELSREMNLPTWDKPSFACLASRFVYGESITEKKLSMVDAAEQFLLDAGFKQVRVRIHGKIARIEISPAEFPKLVEENFRTSLVDKLKSLGFVFVTLDLTGYRTGSMNLTRNSEV